MAVTVHAGALSGIEAFPVTVEVEIGKGLPDFAIIGLGDNAVREARERVSCALKNCGLPVPKQILVSLAPAEIKKEGSSFDLPIGLGILAAQGMIDARHLTGITFHGELALNGDLRPVKGTLALAVTAFQANRSEIVVPHVNLQEARLISGLAATGAGNLVEVLRYLKEGIVPARQDEVVAVKTSARQRDLAEVWGQEFAKRALIVAAAGGHNVLMIGPPGCGKSMLAERFPSLLPPLTESEMLDVVKIHSVAGLPVGGLLSGYRPFRNPHYIISDAGLVGGGAVPRPGEVTLAHRGVLFLDEFPEFRRSAIEALRTPLETGGISVARAKGHAHFPARFQLLAAMNPCPCGKLGTPEENGPRCECSRGAIQNYLKKLSQPILDRIDLHVELCPVPVTVMTSTTKEGVSSETALEQIVLAHDRQRRRNSGVLNADLGSEAVKSVARFRGKALPLLESAAKRAGLSARGFMRVLKVALTISDLAGADEVRESDVAEAIGYRSLERLTNFASGRR